MPTGNVKLGPGVARAVPGRPTIAWVSWLSLCLAALFVTGFGPPRMVDREIAPTVRITVGELRQWAEAHVVEDVTAAAYLVYDMASQQQLFGHEVDAMRAPASLTKLMTALLVLERADLDATVTILPEDLVGGATMGLTPGMQPTVLDLLWGMMVPSGNDAAQALARHVGGSVEEFVATMNVRAAELGLRDTVFINAHGLDAAGHVSSARDMLTLTQVLWGNPLFRTLAGAARVTIQGRELRSTNEWLTSYPGAIGVKTGTTSAAGECLIAAVEREGRTLIVVVMGSENRYTDARRLVEATDAAFTLITPDDGELSLFDRIIVGDGEVHFVQPTGAPPTMLQIGPGFPALRSFRRIEPVAWPELARGKQIGLLEWWAGSESIGYQTLVVR